ncbi:MAG: DUF721 domain-containing protein [Puniceicoccales bacterium]|jgi:hypothetical protein|nr:DUF721 domain-containing protein [Puniceicoccales bacterium]
MVAKKFNLQQRRLIADFCGFGDASMTQMVRMPSSLGAILSKTLGKVVQNCDRLKSIQSSWRGIVGIELASFSRIKNLVQATLSVEVSHRSVLQELKFKEREILDALAKNRQMKCVKRLKFVFVPRATGETIFHLEKKR